MFLVFWSVSFIGRANYLKDHGGYYVDTGLTQVSAKLRAVSQVQLMDLVSER